MPAALRVEPLLTIVARASGLAPGGRCGAPANFLGPAPLSAAEVGGRTRARVGSAFGLGSAEPDLAAERDLGLAAGFGTD